MIRGIKLVVWLLMGLAIFAITQFWLVEFQPEVARDLALRQFEPSDEVARQIREQRGVANGIYIVSVGSWILFGLMLFGQDIKEFFRA